MILKIVFKKGVVFTIADMKFLYVRLYSIVIIYFYDNAIFYNCEHFALEWKDKTQMYAF